MAIIIDANNNINFIGKDKDILASFNSDQSELLLRVVDTIVDTLADYYDSNLISSRIDHVKFSGPATIIFWKDGTKTVVKCTKDDEPDCETGIAMATLKKILGSDYVPYKKKIKKIVDEQTKKDLDTLSKEIAKSIKEGRVNKDEEEQS